MIVQNEYLQDLTVWYIENRIEYTKKELHRARPEKRL